jgi:hypothetical protein
MQADERLSVMCDLNRLVGRIQVYTAPRGYGKTSLLREIQRRAEARAAVTVWVTAGEEHGLVGALADRLLTKGLITAAGYGEVQFTLPGMARCLRSRPDQGALPPG